MNTALIIATLLFGNTQCEGKAARNDDGSMTVTFNAACPVKLYDCLERAVVVLEDGVERETLGCSTDMSSANFDASDLEG
jgi:hypothetical protein